MEIPTSLKTVLKRLKLSGILLSLPERIAYARKAKLSEENFLELVLQDEIDRRDQHNLARRLEQAHFAEEQTLEKFVWDAPITFDRNRVRELFGLGFVERHEDVLFMGPTGVGKTFLASAVGHAACRAGYNVLFVRADSPSLSVWTCQNGTLETYRPLAQHAGLQATMMMDISAETSRPSRIGAADSR